MADTAVRIVTTQYSPSSLFSRRLLLPCLARRGQLVPRFASCTSSPPTGQDSARSSAFRYSSSVDWVAGFDSAAAAVSRLRKEVVCTDARRR